MTERIADTIRDAFIKNAGQSTVDLVVTGWAPGTAGTELDRFAADEGSCRFSWPSPHGSQ